jgi:SEC-C motif domain protein
MTDQPCPCRAQDAEPAPLSACCGPHVEGAKPAPTAEALMRSRYTAYVLGRIDYLENTLAPERRASFHRAAATDWSKKSQWLGLDIEATEAGQPGDATGHVEFTAHYISEGLRLTHREKSLFRFDEADQRWYFVEGEGRKSAPVIRQPRPGRNDPCSCGSGKKYKKCCGVAT